MDSHSISCVLSDIPSQMTVTWTTATAEAALTLAPKDGTIQGTTQTSTLSLSSAQLVKLKATGGTNPAHVFTCKITTGSTTVHATQTINIYTPGRKIKILILLIFHIPTVKDSITALQASQIETYIILTRAKKTII